MKLSIIIPAYNEELRIRPMLDDYLRHFLAIYHDEVEFIIVVNGSTDDTSKVAYHYEETYPQVKVIIEPESVGKGGALMLGFAVAKGDLIGFSDADGATPPSAFEDLIVNLGSADAVIASRWLPESNVHPPQPWTRLLASRVFNMLVGWFFKLKFSDTQCGAKLFRSEALRDVLAKLGITRWAFDVDMLFQLHCAGYQVIEIPTTWHDVDGSKVRVMRTSLDMFFAISRLRLLYSPLRWVVTIYDRLVSRPTRLIREFFERHP